MSTPIATRFTADAVAALRAAIADAGGNEVFVLGGLDEQGKVAEIRVLARGNARAAPAILHLPKPGEVVIHNHPSGRLTPSDADLAVASALGNDGVGFFIVDNAGREVYAAVEPHREAQRVPVDRGEAAGLLHPGGAVARALEGYEERPQQLRMLESVADCFNDDEVLTVEAGTGTGKSLAYLIPAILWSLRNRERVVVSTHTINLQEQLVYKDIPALAKLDGLVCDAVLVKGRGNYLCQRKASQVEAQGGALIEDEFEKEMREILAWARKSKDGSLGDLSFVPRPEVWEQVVSENDNCLRARCPHYSTCFFYTARRAAAKADLLVVNHHLLMADLALREELGSYSQNAVLPPATRLIVDEAHHLEDVATSYFGARISEPAIDRVLGRLQSNRRTERGVLPSLVMALESIDRGDARPLAEGAVQWIDERLLPRRPSVLAEAQQTFAVLLAELENQLGRRFHGSGEKIRITPEFVETPYWEQLSRALARLSASLASYADDMGGVLQRIEDMGPEVEKQVLYLATELGAVQSRLAGLAAGLSAFTEDSPESCRWIEASTSARRGTSLAFAAAPIEVGPLLRTALFERMASVTLTSATLAIDRRFDFLHRRVGLDSLSIPERVRPLLVDSPFDFEQQAILGVPADLPDPAQPRFESAAHEFLGELLRITDGGTFLLFTSYAALERAYQALEGELRAIGCRPLRQSGGSRRHLLEQFVADRRSVLFATDSFWEGVDVRGDALRCVVIARLPFAVPTEPIQQARFEAIQARGGDAFAEYSVPQAAIKLKQGFGRLIRSRTDRGAVVLLDSRVVTRRYGHVFLDSLPPARRVIGTRAHVLDSLRHFFS
jgi:ATP-dependent DNA helicase DinG